MATTTLSSNLKLRISSDLTADSRYNLQRLDSLGSIYQIDTTATAKVRSKTNILLQPNDPDIGGTGTGGTVQLGTADQPLSTLQVYATTVSLGTGVDLDDQATSGTQALKLQYKSDLSGAVDSAADRVLSIDPDGADRELVLGGNLSLGGANLALTLSADTSWTLPADNGLNGQVLTTDGTGALTWESATSASLGGLTDVTISSPTANQLLVYNGSEWVNGTGPIGAETAYTWTPAEGSTKTITHNFGSQQVIATVLDTTNNYQTIEVPDTTRPDGNTLTLTATSAPSGGNWLVLLKQIIT